MVNPFHYAQAFFSSTKNDNSKERERKADNFLKMLWQSGAWKQLPAILKALQEVVNKENGVVEVVVRSAREIPREELDAQQEKMLEMAAKFGATGKLKTVTVKNEVVPNLVGGIELLINGVKIDGSLLTQLERFKNS